MTERPTLGAWGGTLMGCGCGTDRQILILSIELTLYRHISRNFRALRPQADFDTDLEKSWEGPTEPYAAAARGGASPESGLARWLTLSMQCY